MVIVFQGGLKGQCSRNTLAQGWPGAVRQNLKKLCAWGWGQQEGVVLPRSPC